MCISQHSKNFQIKSKSNKSNRIPKRVPICSVTEYNSSFGSMINRSCIKGCTTRKNYT